METTRSKALEGTRGESVSSAATPADSGSVGRKPFEPPKLTKHEPLQNVTLVSASGSGVTGATFF